MGEVVRTLSLGAGVQSSALLLLFDTGLQPAIDFAVFADTGAEPKPVYDWLDKLEKAVSIPIIRASRGHIVDDMLNKEGRRFASAPFFIKHPNGKRGMGRRQCTREYKIDVITKAIRTRLGYEPYKKVKHTVFCNIGISTDEATRMKPSRIPWQVNVWPLIDLGMSREDCVRYVEASGLGTPPKSACYMCPFHSDKEWAQMKNSDPETWDLAVKFDTAIRSDAAVSRGMRGEQFLHAQLVPLTEVKFKDDENKNPMDNECEGMCGV